jgi:DNA polymerase-3 subunit beta
VAEAGFEGDLHLSPRMLIPRKALAVMKKLLESNEEPIEVSFGEGAIRLGRPSQMFWFRLLDGEFPEYQAVVPKENRHRAVLRRSELISTLKRIMILVQERTRAVRFDFQENALEIEVQNVERGEVKEALPIELEGDPITAGFNARYLQDILSVMTGDQVSLELNHQLAPCLVRDPEDPSAFFVVMPMRLD